MNPNILTSSLKHFQSLTFSTPQGKIKLKFNPDCIEQARAKLVFTSQPAQPDIPVVWHLDELNLKERVKILRRNTSCLQLKNFSAFEVHICVNLQALQEQRASSLQKNVLRLCSQLNQGYFRDEHIRLERHVEWLKRDPEKVSEIFWELIAYGKNNPSGSRAAANAATILNRAFVSFSKRDLSGISMPYADLSGAILEGADLSQADLQKVRLDNTCLLGVNLTGAHLEGVEFGIQPYLEHQKEVCKFALSADDRYLAVWTREDKIVLWDLGHSPHTVVGQIPLRGFGVDSMRNWSSSTVRELGFSSDCECLLIAYHQFIVIWKIHSLEQVHTFPFIKERSLAFFGFSPNGQWGAYNTFEGFLHFLKIPNRTTSLKDTEACTWKVNFTWNDRPNGCFSPDSHLFAFFGVSSGPIYWLKVAFLDSQREVFFSLSFLPYRLRFVSNRRLLLLMENKQDEKTIVWECLIKENLEELKPTFLFESQNRIDQIEFLSTSAGKNYYFYTINEPGYICVRDLDQQREICRFTVFREGPQIQIFQKKDFILSSWGKKLVAILKIEYLVQRGIFQGQPIENFYFSTDSQSIISLSSGRPFGLMVSSAYSMNKYLITPDQTAALKVDLGHLGRTIERLESHPSSWLIMETPLPPLLSFDQRYLVHHTFEEREQSRKMLFYLWDIQDQKKYWAHEWINVTNYHFVLSKLCEQAAFLLYTLVDKHIAFELQAWDLREDALLLKCDLMELPTMTSLSPPFSFLIAATSQFLPRGSLIVAINTVIFLIKMEGNGQEVSHVCEFLASTEDNKRICQMECMGNLLYALEEDGECIRCWDIDTKEEQEPFEDQKANILSFSVSLDGTQLVYISDDQRLALWDIPSRRKIIDVSTHVDLMKVKFSPDGRRIAAYEKKAGILYVWEIQGSTLRLIRCTPKSLDCRGANITGTYFDEDGLNKKILQQLGASEKTEEQESLYLERLKLKSKKEFIIERHFKAIF